MSKPILAVDAHAQYIKELGEKKEDFEYVVTEHLRMSGVYWGVTALHLMGRGELMAGNEVVAWVLSCQHPSGGFGGSVNHDEHLLYTLSALQLLALHDALGQLPDREVVVQYIVSLQLEDGSFMGDKWGEVDTRFSYCAVVALALLGRLDACNQNAAAAFILSCRNFDGGFGCVPGAETHGGQIWTSLAALSVLNRLDTVADEFDILGTWLAERQLPCGGFNGRPEKKEDVCYSWWILASLSILGKVQWIEADALTGFILKCQDVDSGGIADRPGDIADIFHTFFGITGLSLLQQHGKASGKENLAHSLAPLGAIDPVYALPLDVVERCGIQKHGNN
jgi:geranylgeranyl transferase type-2 subunit beta